MSSVQVDTTPLKKRPLPAESMIECPSPIIGKQVYKARRTNTLLSPHTKKQNRPSPLDGAVSFQDVNVQMLAAHSLAHECRRAVEIPQEKVLTRAQVQMALNLAMQRFESLSRQRYSEAVERISKEQFEKFDKFNDDFVSRKLGRSDYSYMS
jgi:hypothetical protein